MADLLTMSVPAGVAVLLARELARAVQYRNGADRRLSEDKVRLVVQQELGPVKEQLAEVSDKVAGLVAVQNALAFAAAHGKPR